MSYIFYGFWDWRFCLLLAGTTAVTFACALPRSHRRAWCTVAIALNLAVLVIFKYFNFFGNGLTRFLALFGWAVDWFTLDVLLPVGISFYTFQAISYSVDVYRRDIMPTRDFIAFAGFLSFFPQLVAGPIERSTQLLPQFFTPRAWDRSRTVEGLKLILWGMFKKCAVADALMSLTTPLWDSNFSELTPFGAVIAVIGFAIQIYADFSGYSDIARGAAKLLGFELMVNFRTPFFSRNIVELWHRWHISLMQWFTHYVYIPLGGSRKGNRYVNIMIVFFLSGLWHGAHTTFVIWGILCGLVYILAIAFNARRYNPRKVAPASRRDLLNIAATFLIFSALFIAFRAPDIALLGRALGILSWPSIACACGALAVAAIVARLPFRFNFTLIFSTLIALGILTAFIRPEIFYSQFIWRHGLITALLMFMIEWRARNHSYGLAVMPRRRWVRWVVYMALYLVVISGAASSYDPFLYFQF